MQEHIRSGSVEKITQLIARSSEHGMQTFDQAMLALFKKGVITAEQAMRAADSENDVRLAIKLDSSGSHASGRQTFDVEMPTGTHVDKWWQNQK